MSRCRNLIALGTAGGLLVLTAITTPALASDEPEVIVLESYGGMRPDDAEELLAPLYAELGERGYGVDAADLSGRIGDKLSQPGQELESSRIAEAVEMTGSGFQHWLDGDPARAVKHLAVAIELFHQRPATVARAPKLRDHVFTALIGLSLAYHRLGAADKSSATMAELLRSFPDREISPGEYGPEPRALYRKIKEELGAQGYGTLRVRSNDPGVTVFLNERYVGVGDLDLDKLFVGTYRIYLQKGSVRGRVHEVTVSPGTESQLSIAWGLETSVRSGDGFAGFEFASEEERRERAYGYAVTLARRISASGVILVGVRSYQGRRSVVGTVLSLDASKPVRLGAVAIEPTAPSDEQMRSLAQFLAGDGPSPGILVGGGDAVGGSDGAEGAQSAPVTSGRYRRWKWIALVGGVVGIAGGATLIAIHQPAASDGGQNAYSRDTLVPGIVMAAGGAVLVGVGVLLWRKAGVEHRETTFAVSPTRTGWALSLCGRF